MIVRHVREYRRERNASHLDDLVGRRMSANNTERH